MTSVFQNYIIRELQNTGHEVLLLKDYIPPDSSDSAVISKSQELDSILVSLNGDFADIVTYPPLRYKGILSLQVMPHGGTIYIQADNITLGSENMLALKAGDYIKISIKNKGTRIPHEQIQRVSYIQKQDDWSPSIAWSYSVVKSYHGHIIEETKPGFGTTFSIYLPASPEIVKREKQEKTLIHGHGRILVMDDEDMVRHITGKMLYQLGYKAEFVENGDDAIKAYKKAIKSRENFDAVIIDLTIPGGMGGKETIQQLLSVDPQVKAIVASGYPHDPVMSGYNKFGFCGAITKPFAIEEFGMELQRIIVNK